MPDLNWKAVSEICRQYSVRTRTKLSGDPCSEWCTWLIVPHPGYIEPEALGPVPLTDIEYVEIDPVERKRRGRLVADLLIDHRPEIESALTAANVPFAFVNGVLRLRSESPTLGQS